LQAALNKKRGRKETFWAERFKSVIVEKGVTLINCLAYIDLHPVESSGAGLQSSI